MSPYDCWKLAAPPEPPEAPECDLCRGEGHVDFQEARDFLALDEEIDDMSIKDLIESGRIKIDKDDARPFCPKCKGTGYLESEE